MTHFITLAVSYLLNMVGNGRYVLLLGVSVLEGIPIIGQFVPGHTIVILSGFLSKMDLMNIYVVVPIVIIGAIIGDIIGYFIGKKYGFSFLARFGKYLFIKKEHIEKAQKLVQENTIKTIIVGRFSPITRAITPFIVGASGVHIRKFWFYDIIAVILWSISSIAIGYVFGASYHTISAILGKYILLATIIGVLIIWGYRFINKQFHIFAKYELITLIINLVGLYLFFKTIQDAVTDHVFLAEIDLWINNFFQLTHGEWGYRLMNFITNIMGPEFIAIPVFIGIVYFIYKKYWSSVVISVIAFVGGISLSIFLKDVVMRLRPLEGLIAETGYSFPSNHAVAVTIFFTLVIYFFARKIKSIVAREIFIVVCVVAILAVSFSRIYLGVHWFSDVIAGIGLGLFFTTFVILLVQYISIVVKVFKK